MRTPVLDLLRPLIGLLARAYFGVRFEGLNHVPREGPLIIASNHVTYADPVLMSLPVRRPIYYMAWRRLFDVPGLGWLIRRVRAFPVETEIADTKATRMAMRLLRAGQALLIFPEGARSLDGRLQPFKLGAFRLACLLEVPVLPVTIVGGHESWPPHRRFPHPGRITMFYHPPVKPGLAPDLRDAAREMARQVQAAVASRLPHHQKPAGAGAE